MKRISGFIAAFLITAAMAGCSADNTPAATTSDTPAQSTTTAAQTTAAAETEKAADTTASQAATEETTQAETTAEITTTTEAVTTEEEVVASPAQTEAETAQDAPSYSAYIFRCRDTDGNPVSNVMIQICTDEMCMVATSDDNGDAIHDGEPFGYDIHIFRYPDGYELSSEQHFSVDAEYGEYNVVFTKK